MAAARDTPKPATGGHPRGPVDDCESATRRVAREVREKLLGALTNPDCEAGAKILGDCISYWPDDSGDPGFEDWCPSCRRFYQIVILPAASPLLVDSGLFALIVDLSAAIEARRRARRRAHFGAGGEALERDEALRDRRLTEED
jgi:hypothetical protein